MQACGPEHRAEQITCDLANDRLRDPAIVEEGFDLLFHKVAVSSVKGTKNPRHVFRIIWCFFPVFPGRLPLIHSANILEANPAPQEGGADIILLVYLTNSPCSLLSTEAPSPHVLLHLLL